MWEAVLVIAVVLFIIALVGYWVNRNKPRLPSWVWTLIAISILLVVVTMVINSYESYSTDALLII